MEESLALAGSKALALILAYLKCDVQVAMDDAGEREEGLGHEQALAHHALILDGQLKEGAIHLDGLWQHQVEGLVEPGGHVGYPESVP